MGGVYGMEWYSEQVAHCGKDMRRPGVAQVAKGTVEHFVVDGMQSTYMGPAIATEVADCISAGVTRTSPGRLCRRLVNSHKTQSCIPTSARTTAARFLPPVKSVNGNHTSITSPTKRSPSQGPPPCRTTETIREWPTRPDRGRRRRLDFRRPHRPCRRRRPWC